MRIAINTDFCNGLPIEDCLREIAAAGFASLLWGHHWNDDFLYSGVEIQAIRGMLERFGLELLDLHGSAGQEKCWFSTVEYERLAGVELVRNRLRMFGELSGRGVLVMHTPAIRSTTPPEEIPRIWQRVEALKRSLDELLPEAERCHCPIAIENHPRGSWQVLNALFDAYPSPWFGLCYDSGHGHVPGGSDQLAMLNARKNRLLAIHLHDNDSSMDQHQPPGFGTLDWEPVLTAIAESSYRNEALFEVRIDKTPFFPANGAPGLPEARAFLADAAARAATVAAMLKEKRARGKSSQE